MRPQDIYLIVLSAIFFFGANFCYAFEWRKVHEEADKKDIKQVKIIQQENPQSQEVSYLLGLVYLNSYKNKEAGYVFDKMLSGNPGSIEAKWGLAEVLRRRHELNKSEKILNEIIKENPQFSPAYISLAYIRYIKLDFEGASKLAYRVVKQQIKNVDTTNYVRALLLYAGAKGMIAHYGGPISKIINGTAVFPALDAARKLLPKYPGVYYGFGSFYLLAPEAIGGDIDIAKQYLEKAIKADPFFADSYVRLSQVYQLKKDEVEAQIYLNKALAVDSGNELALDIKNGNCKFICVQAIKD
ncbi:MAG: tetratricopeptide repeat protein [Candidatus Omnitrophica bacterium]|jgi:tetratricopeptide (TPR) repeat protein|nr:tetratricopeptide repeat protein [Candidatus Omnitrophota bacterium]